MTDKSDLSDLEQRLAISLHKAAPRPSPVDVNRLLRTAVAAPQRRGLFGFSFAPALGAAAVVAAAVAVGLVLGTLMPRVPDVGGPSESAVGSSSPEATPEPTATPSDASTPSPSADAFPGGSSSCENEAIGFTVSYPADWWANELVDPDDPQLTPIPACGYFAEEPVELLPNAGLPPGIAIVADIDERPAGQPEQQVEVIETREETVAGRQATVEEVEWTADTVFERAGDRAYRYRISLSSGETLRFATIARQPSAEYDAHRAVLDAMMETLELTGG